MFELRENQMRLPFGGHHYPEPGLTIRGESFKEVVDQLGRFRINNGSPMGNPEQDVLVYYAKNFPWMVRESQDNPPVIHDDFVTWRSSIHRMWRAANKKYVTKKEASLRWESCQKCPHNLHKAWPETEESKELERRALLLRRAEKIPEDLGTCGLHEFDLGVASFLDAPSQLSNKQKDIAQPGCCWV